MQADQKDLVQIFLLKIKKKIQRLGVLFGLGGGWGGGPLLWFFSSELS